MSERDRSDEAWERGKKRQRAITRADIRLREMYPREYRQLLNEELVKLGLPPIGVLRPGGRARRT